MATNYICTVGASGCDYTAPATYESDHDVDWTLSSSRVYSVTVKGSPAPSNENTLYLFRGGTYQTVTCNYLKYNLAGHLGVRAVSTVATPQTDDVWSVSNANDTNGYTITSTIGSGNGDTAIPTMEIDGEIEITTGITFTGWTLSDTNRLIIRSKNSAKRSPSSPLRYGYAAGRISHTGSTGWALSILPSSSAATYVTIQDIDIQITDTTNTSGCLRWSSLGVGNNQITVERVVCRDSSTASSYCVQSGSSNAVCTVRNCVFYGNMQAAPNNSFRVSSSTCNIYHCVFYNHYNTSSYGVYLDSGTGTVYNSIARGVASAIQDAFYGSWTTKSCCASNDESGTTGLQNLTLSNEFAALDAGTEDFRLQSGASCIAAGDDNDPTSDDVYGMKRPAVIKDVGADQSVNVAVTGIVTTGAPAIVGVAESSGAGVTATGIVTTGGVSVAGAVQGAIIASGAITTGGVAVLGASLYAPYELFCNDGITGAGSGETNPTDLTDLTPVFSAKCHTLGANITHVQIQVSAIDDANFSETPSWDSGWLLLMVERAEGERTEDIEYAQENP